MRLPIHRNAGRTIAVALAPLTLSGCFLDRLPTESQRPAAVARAAFGDALVWFTADDDGAGSMKPALAGEHVYFERDRLAAGGAPSELVAVDRGTGAIAWAGPMIAGENAAIAGDAVGAVWGSLSIFDRASGARRHAFTPGTTPLSGNVVSDGARFYVLTHDARAVAVDPVTGQAVWTTPLAGGPETVGSGVAVEGDALAASAKHFSRSAQGDSGIVAVLERATGAVRWRVAVRGAADPGIVEPPVIAAGLVIVVTQGHDVRAFDLATGALRWQVDASFSSNEWGSNGLAGCEGVVIVPTGDLGLAGLDAATGAVRWRRGDLGEGSLFSVRCSHGTAMALGSVGLQVFDARTGDRRARYPVREPAAAGREFWISSVVRDDQYLYVGTTYGFARVRAP